jgi:DNA-binding protein H-NS
LKTPIFSKMTVDALITARETIDKLLKKRVPAARKELEQRLSALHGYFGADSGTANKASGDGRSRSKLKGRKVPPKYRSKQGETWSGRGMMPRWLTAAIKGGAERDDFAIGAGRRRKRAKRVSSQDGKKRTTAKRAAPKRKKAAKQARQKATASSAQTEATTAV